MNRRTLLRKIATVTALTLYSPFLLLSGCPVDTDDLAALMTTLGGAASQLAAVLGNSALAATITSRTAAASAAVAAWKAGMPTAEAIEAINALESAISQITGINPTISLLVTLALGTADAVLLLLPPASVTPAMRTALASRQRIKLNTPPTKKTTFVDFWNDLIAASPDATLVGAKL